ncbi:hypothetical protein BK135_00995 [Paenibacillus peoriae]|nr:hypothetical protein BK135_00995 [Paenibacillus peoriae]
MKQQETVTGLDDKPITLDFDVPADERVSAYIGQVLGQEGEDVDKDKIRELFEQLLGDYKSSEEMVIHERGGDYDELEGNIVEYREELEALLNE